MPKPLSSAYLAASVCSALFLFAFVAAPNSCEWGLETYVWSGLVSMSLLAVAPFFAPFRPLVRSSGLQSLLYAAVVACTWTAGLFAANVRIVCRLF